MLNPEADLRELVESLQEPICSEARDHLPLREVREKVAKTIRVTQELQRWLSCERSANVRERIHHGIKMALLDLERSPAKTGV